MYTLQECMEHAYQVLDSGIALQKFRQMMLAQGAEEDYLTKALDTPEEVPLARYQATWIWKDGDDCTIVDIPAKVVGNACVMLGAGRTVAGQQVDAAAGMVFSKKVGDAVQKGVAIVTIYTNISQELADSVRSLVASSWGRPSY